MTDPSPLDVRVEGFCTHTRTGKRPKIRYPTAGDASMGLVETRERMLARGHTEVPVAYYCCDYCDGFHLTSHPTPATATPRIGPRPRRP